MKTSGVVVDYIGLAEEVQRAVADPTAESVGKGGGFVTDLSELVAEFRTAFARIEDLLADVDGLDLTVHGYESVRAINAFLDADPAAAEAFSQGLPAPGPPIPAHQHRQAGQPSTGTGSGCSDPCTRPCSRSPPTRRGRNGWAS